MHAWLYHRASTRCTLVALLDMYCLVLAIPLVLALCAGGVRLVVHFWDLDVYAVLVVVDNPRTAAVGSDVLPYHNCGMPYY